MKFRIALDICWQRKGSQIINVVMGDLCRVNGKLLVQCELPIETNEESDIGTAESRELENCLGQYHSAF